MITEGQHRKYFREWGKARRVLRAQGIPPTECDTRRHEIHLEELGEDKSHWDFDNDDFDDVLSEFFAISEPSNLNIQLKLANGRRERRLFRIRKLARSMGADDRYVQAIVDQMDARRNDQKRAAGEDEPDKWQRERERDDKPQRKLEDLHPAELTKVMIALRQHEKRVVIAEPELD